jgi:hypothetical protein
MLNATWEKLYEITVSQLERYDYSKSHQKTLLKSVPDMV